MGVVLATLAALGGALAVVVRQLRSAPLGYEDEQGFHLVQHIRGSGIRRHPKSIGAPPGSLKGAGARL